MNKIPHQSNGPYCRFPGSSIAARELGVHRGHLHAVLSGKRDSKVLMARWNDWLKTHPAFLKANRAAQRKEQHK
jgi:hypothetical protein